MTVHVNVAKAKATLSELIARAESGEDVILTRHGKPVAHIVPASPAPAPKPHRRIGAFAHLGPLANPYIFHEPDLELEALMDKSIWPEE